MSIGTFSISLTVKDINASKAYNICSVWMTKEHSNFATGMTKY